MTPLTKVSLGLPARAPISAGQTVSWAGMTLPIIACAAIWGIGDADAANAVWLTTLHSGIAAAATAWTVLRFVLRRHAPPRPTPASDAPWGPWVSASLPALYALLVVQPLLAAAGSMLHGRAATLFGIPLPAILPMDPSWADRIDQIHGCNALLLLGLIAAQIASAVSAARRPGAIQ